MRTKETVFAAQARERVERRDNQLADLAARLRAACADPARYDALRRTVGSVALTLFIRK